MKYYVDAENRYLGGWDENPPEGAIEAPTAPADARQLWTGDGWGPVPEPIPASISFAQLLIGLVSEGWITEADGDAWLTGTLPAPVLALIATLPAEQQFAAKARASRPSEVLRMDPLVQALGASQGKTTEELDDFFRTYANM